jgi:hypothetical protein
MKLEKVEIDATQVLREMPERWLGINVNYMLDHDKNPAAPHRGKPKRPLAEALREMGVKWLRYPGGDKSDAYFWSVPPFDRPRPELVRGGQSDGWRRKDLLFHPDGTWKAKPMDFDAFIALCRKVGAEPICVVCFDSMYWPAEGFTPPTKAQLFENARQWVRYSNVKKKYGVKWWEIGNESYLFKTGPAAAEYAKTAKEFIQAMKVVDPTIKVGVNGAGDKDKVWTKDLDLGRKDAWWPTVLKGTARDADFLAIHEYAPTAWGSYAHYLKNTPEVDAEPKRVANMLKQVLPGKDEARLSLAMTELNAVDFNFDKKKKRWPNVNDMGHAVVLADTIASVARHPKVNMALVWNTRWFDSEKSPIVWDTLDKHNGLLPTGKVLSLLSKAFRRQVVAGKGTKKVGVHAFFDPKTENWSALLINRDIAPRLVHLEAKGFESLRNAKGLVLSGKGPGDLKPQLKKLPALKPEKSGLVMKLPAVSVSLLEVKTA